MVSTDSAPWPRRGRRKIALVIAGGGSLGAYEAGVLNELIWALETHNAGLNAAERFLVDVVTGASAGGMNAAMFVRFMLTDVSRRGELHDAWVREISMPRLLEEDPQQGNALFSKQVLFEIAARHLVDGTSAAVRPASFAPAAAGTRLLLSLALTNLNGLDYVLPRHGVATKAEFLTTRFSDAARFEFAPPQVPGPEVWTRLKTAALACGNFPLAFQPQAMGRDASDYPQGPIQAQGGFFPRTLAFVDGGMFDNEPLGEAIRLASALDGGQPDPARLFLLVHPNIDASSHAEITPALSLMGQLQRLLGMLRDESAATDWVRAQQVNGALRWRDAFLLDLVALVAPIADPGALRPSLDHIVALAAEDRVAAGGAPQGAAAYVEAAFARLRSRLPPQAADLAPLRREVLERLVFILDHVSSLQSKAPLWLEVIGVGAGAAPLAGAQIEGFAGFFEQAWRSHDYRRGRIDAWSALQQIFGAYPREPAAQQPTRPARPEDDEYTLDPAWRARWPSLPFLRLADVDPALRQAVADRIVQRAKSALGLSGLEGWLFGLAVRKKVGALLDD